MKTNIRHFGWIIALLSMFPTSGYAQSETNVEERLEKIEAQLKQQESIINSLRSEIEAVTKQNLALKKNLKLQPTIAKYIEDNVMEFRIIEVTGNSETGDVEILMTVNNLASSDKVWQVSQIQIVNELGTDVNTQENCTVSVGDRAFGGILMQPEVNYHPDAPYNIRIRIKKYNTDSQYIKYLKFRMFYSANYITAAFENLPIKWVSED